MKPIILFLMLMGFYITSFAQKFEASPNGLRDSSNIENSYLILNFEGKTAKELYDKSVEYVIKSYKNPDEVLKGKIESEYLRYDTYMPNILYIRNMGLKQYFNATFSVVLNFKDGKIKYEITDLDMRHFKNNMQLYFEGDGISWYIFKNNKLEREGAKKDVEVFFNALLKAYLIYMNDEIQTSNW